MSKRLHILVLLLLLIVGKVASQDIRYETDPDCGCDLLYVDGIQTTREGELYGFQHADGRLIAPCIYQKVGLFTKGFCQVQIAEGRMGIIDTAGREVIPCIYEHVELPAEGLVLMQRDGLYGYCNLNGEEVIEPQYLYAGNFSEGCATVMMVVDSVALLCTFIDTLGRQLFPPIYQNLKAFSCGYALVRRYDRWGVMDHAGREVLNCRFEQITDLFDTLFFAGDGYGMALYDGRMQPLTKAVYTWVGAYVDGRIPVQRGGRYGFLDRMGREVVECEYDEVSIFAEGRAMVARDGKYGIIDTVGRFILPMEYENSTPYGHKYVYSDGLALVEKDGRLGFVDIEGKLRIPMYFDAAFHFSEGLASVRHKGMWGYVDTTGEVFMPFVFEMASPYRWGRANVRYMGQSRTVDSRGRCVKNCNGIIAWRDWNE